MPNQDFKLASIIHKGFTQHEELNPQIFDEEQRIRPEVREKLILAANDFIDTLNIDNIDFEDIVIVGSIANYNWNPYSDVDLHIIFDFKEIDENIELVSEFFMAKKSLWNQDHDVKIYEYDVELYGQDINEENASGAVYSLMQNEWVKKPAAEQYEVSETSLIKKTKYFIKLLDDVLELDVTDETKIKKLKAIKEKIRKYRKSGLETGGEYSEENLTFKMLRRSGYLEKLSDIKNELEDNMMSLSEGLSIPKKKYQPKYFDNETSDEFPIQDIDKHPLWYKEEYDNNGKLIYREESNGYWTKYEYDKNGNQIYWEDNDGKWSKREYNVDGRIIYWENSTSGVIEDYRNLQEGLMLGYKKFPDRYYDIETNKEFPKSEINKHKYWEKEEYNNDGLMIYTERSDGWWVRYEYDENGNQLYWEDSDGKWAKREYNADGRRIYWENSTSGVIEDYRNLQEGLMLPYKDLSTPELWFKDLAKQMETYKENLLDIDNITVFHINGVAYMEYYDFSNAFNYCHDYINSVLVNKFDMDGKEINAFLRDMMKKYYNLDLQTANMYIVFYNRI